jgi:hypothetical protein
MIESTYEERLEATYQAIMNGDIILEDGVSPWEEPESPEEVLSMLKLDHRLADQIRQDFEDVFARCEASINV